jgi:hypothetical protein
MDTRRLTLVLLAALAASPAPVHAAPPAGCPVVRSHAGNTSGDWEASFGFRKLHRRAAALLDRVHAKGFRCAVIENEQGTHDVAIIGLATRRAAEKLVTRAHRAGLKAHAARS